MREQFKKLPGALQRQILLRLGGGILFFLLLAVFLLCVPDIYLILPCVLFGACLTWNGCYLYHQGISGNYVRLGGKCVRVETAGIRKRVRAVYVAYEKGTVKIPIRHKIKELAVGDTVTVYVPEHTTVYEQEEQYILTGYYAMEVENKR